MHRPPQNRNGITLLFVVSMIVLFLLMGTAFVVVSNDFLRSAKKRSRHDLHSIDGTALIERAFYDLVREPDLGDATSPLRGHSLLGDMYGYGVTANVATASVNSSQQFITLTLDFAGSGRSILDESSFAPDPVSTMAGLVLSFTNGPATGMSTRIVDHQVSGDSGSGYTHSFVVQPDWSGSQFNVSQAVSLVGTHVVINGRPFSGTGAGNFNPRVGLNFPALSTTALQPNQVGRSRAELLGQTGAGYLSRGSTTQTANSSSTNEPYDTFDFQNMFLAGINPDGSVLVPSFHRDDLILHSPNRTDFRAFPNSPNNGIEIDNDNSGTTDGVWVDIGLPNQSAANGIHFKPLISYTVVDLDGRSNVNAHGSLFDGAGQMTDLPLLGDPLPDDLHRGQGYGPPEIGLTPVLGGSWLKVVSGDGTTPGRYGVDGFPGEANVRDGWSAYKMFGYPDTPFSDAIPGTIGGQFGSALDVHGRFGFGYPYDITDKDDFSIRLPGSTVSTSDLANEVLDSAYEMSFADGTMAGPDGRGFDTPFTPKELEGVLRRSDIDSSLLADRLWNLGQAAFNSAQTARNSVTTSSFEVPTTIENLPQKLTKILTANGVAEADLRQQVSLLLPAEVFRGLPMNVNRPLVDGTVTHPSGVDIELDNDNDSQVSTADTDAFLARYHFARHLYIVTLLSTERVDRNGDGMINLSDWYDFNDDGTTDQADLIDFRKTIAQWAVNCVDFRDNDVVMTPFEVDLNPWDGWGVDGMLTTDEPALGNLRAVFWGSERPELLISETFATHDRRTQDLNTDTTGEYAADEGGGADPMADFDSHLVPTASVFFELYNPWVLTDAAQSRPAELYDANLDGLDLQKTSSDGRSPVWRLMVTGNDESELDPDDESNNPELTSSPPTYEQASSVRLIYFTKPKLISLTGPEAYYPDASINPRPMPPGEYAVIGSAGKKVGNEYVTWFGRRAIADPLKPEELKTTRQIVLNPTTGDLKVGYWDDDTDKMAEEVRTNVISVPIGRHGDDWQRSLGVSDPTDGYAGLTGDGLPVEMTEVADGYKFTVNDPAPETDYVFDEPVDRQLDEDHYDTYLANDGLRPAYRTVHLQRLANPLISFNAKTNPYRTIDSSSLDLVVFNGIDVKSDPNNTPTPIRFGSFERQAGLDASGDPAVNGQDESNGRQRLLFRNDRSGHQFPKEADSKVIPLDDHVFPRNFVESFGGLNQAYIEAATTSQQPFAALVWNNRPFTSQLELANVPFTSSYWMTRLFCSSDPNRDVFGPDRETDASTGAKNYTAHFPHLLNFYADQLADGSDSAGLHRVFDYLEVPSRFVGTESYVNPASFLGTMHGLSFGMSAPFDTISNYRYPGKLNINTVLDERVWNGLMRLYAVDPGDPLTYNQWNTSRNGSGSFNFANPYRSPLTANRVPLGSLKVDPVECGLFRSDGSGQPLFDYNPPKNALKLTYNNDDRCAYFKYDRRQRLGNLVTSRSSVFAIWITVGYFELEQDGSLKLRPDGSGMELGAETGELKRNRGFYLFDRSIPVAFEPGKNHNVDRAVLVRTMIE